jgi:hypothetical protein
MRQVIDIAKKLELTSIALGCLTRKELCAAFARVNPNTVMSLQNSYNWQSGRAVPRNFGLFEDWAAAVGLSEGPHFIMSSSLDEFARVIGAKFALPDGLLASFGRAPAQTPTLAPATATAEPMPRAGIEPAEWRNGALLRGRFLVLSLSWSPVQRGRLVCGVIDFDTGGGGNLSAHYIENVLGRRVAYSGSGLEDGKTGQVALRCDANGATYLMALHLPPLPGNLAGGILAGNALYDPNSEPTAGPILLLRNHQLPPAALEDIAGYRDLDDAAIAGCLEQLGYGRDPAFEAEQAMRGLLAGEAGGSLVSVGRDALGRVAVLLDRRRLQATGQT